MLFLSRRAYLTVAVLWGLVFSAASEASCHRPCCDTYSGIYAGIIGFGTTFSVDDSGIGLDEYYGANSCSNHIDGIPLGLMIGYTYRNPCHIYFNVEFDWAEGNLNGGRHCIGDIPNRYLNNYVGVGKLGYNFRLDHCLLFTPYVGLGYRYLYQELPQSRRISYSNWFGVLGGRIDWQWNHCFSIGVDGQWFIPFDASVKLNEFCRELSVGNGYGYQLELPLTYSLPCCCDNLQLILAPFYRKIAYGKSRYYTFDIETVRVPQVKFQDYGAKLYIEYLF